MNIRDIYLFERGVSQAPLNIPSEPLSSFFVTIIVPHEFPILLVPFNGLSSP